MMAMVGLCMRTVSVCQDPSGLAMSIASNGSNGRGLALRARADSTPISAQPLVQDRGLCSLQGGLQPLQKGAPPRIAPGPLQPVGQAYASQRLDLAHLAAGGVANPGPAGRRLEGPDRSVGLQRVRQADGQPAGAVVLKNLLHGVAVVPVVDPNARPDVRRAEGELLHRLDLGDIV